MPRKSKKNVVVKCDNTSDDVAVDTPAQNIEQVVFKRNEPLLFRDVAERIMQSNASASARSSFKTFCGRTGVRDERHSFWKFYEAVTAAPANNIFYVPGEVYKTQTRNSITTEISNAKSVVENILKSCFEKEVATALIDSISQIYAFFKDEASWIKYQETRKNNLVYPVEPSPKEEVPDVDSVTDDINDISDDYSTDRIQEIINENERLKSYNKDISEHAKRLEAKIAITVDLLSTIDDFWAKGFVRLLRDT